MASALISALRSPPAWATHLASDDPDEVTSWVARRDGHHSRVIHGSGPYGFRFDRVGTPTVQVGWGRTRVPHTLHAAFLQPTLHLPLAGVQRYACGRHRFGAPAGTLVFIAAGTVVSRYSDADPIMAIDIEPGTLQRELASRCGGDRRELARVPLVFDLAQPGAVAVVDAIVTLVAAHAQPSAAAVQHAEGNLLDAVSAALSERCGPVPARVARRRLGLLEDWIEANLAEPLTLGRLCDVAQVSARTLQSAFQARRGMSPMRFVSERRLAAVQRRLIQGDPDENVTAIAVRLGFTHLGRFSSSYRALFGELPSRTLARGRRSSGA